MCHPPINVDGLAALSVSDTPKVRWLRCALDFSYLCLMDITAYNRDLTYLLDNEMYYPKVSAECMTSIPLQSLTKERILHFAMSDPAVLHVVLGHVVRLAAICIFSYSLLQTRYGIPRELVISTRA